MKHAKMLGLAVVAAFAFMAFAGAGTVSATQICKGVERGGDGKCRNGSFEKELAKGESFTVTSTDLILTSGVLSVACSSSSVRLKMTSKNGISLIKGKITALSFAGCKTGGGTNCSTTVTNLPYAAVLHPPDILVSDPAGVAIHVNCGFLISCELTAQEQLLAVEGNLLVASSEVPATKQGFCPVAPRLDASYSARAGFTFSS